MRHPISPEKPLFILEQGDGMPIQELWHMMPEEFRQYCAVLLHAPRSKETGAWEPTWHNIRVAQDVGVPVFLSVQGYEQDSSGCIPIEELARLFQEFPNFIGLRSCELSCYALSDSQKEYLIDIMYLCGEFKAWLTWQDMGFFHILDKQHVFIQAGTDERLFNAILKNGEVVILTDKHNGRCKFFLTRSLVLGMWSSGITSQWGVNSEDWWWFEMGYGPRFTPSKGSRGYAKQHGSGPEATKGWDYASAISSPDILYAQYLLTCIAAGATFYSFEMPSHAYFHRDRNGDFRITPAWKNVIYPLFRMILDHDLIPKREEVLARMPVAYHITKLDGTEMEQPSEKLFRPLYGARASDEEIMKLGLSPEFIPRTGRYFQLPVLPKLAPEWALSRFPNIIKPNQFATADAQRQYFNEIFPAESSGEAMVMRVKNRWFITNTHENQNIPESFSFPLAIDGSEVTLSGHLEPNSILIVCQEVGDLLFHANNYIVNTHIWDEPRPEEFDIEAYLQDYVTEPDDSEWRLTNLCIAGMKMEASIKYTVNNGKVQWTWNKEDGNLGIQLQHNGPVDLTISFHGYRRDKPRLSLIG
jgi:hypothetical protein